MKAILLHNWKAKIASLVLAVAIWFLIQLSIQVQLPPEIPVPGEEPPKRTIPPNPLVPEGPPTTPPIPGLGGVFPPACEEVVTMAQVHSGFYRLHWFENDRFAASLVEFPAKALL